MEGALWGRKAEKSKPTLWKPPLQDRNLATLEFLRSWYAIRRSLQKNKSSLPGIPRSTTRHPSAKWTRPVGVVNQPSLPPSLQILLQSWRLLAKNFWRRLQRGPAFAISSFHLLYPFFNIIMKILLF